MGGYAFAKALIWMIAANALWAAAFIVPVAVPDATAMDILIGRYMVYGMCSLFLLLKTGLPRLSAADWGWAVLFAIIGHLVYYYVMIVGIQLAGPALAVPIIGLLPVSVALFGGLRGGDVSMRSLVIPLAGVLIGLVLVNLSRSEGRGGDLSASQMIGIGLSFLTVVFWTWFAIANIAFLRRRPDIPGLQWASVVGLVILAFSFGGLFAGVVFGSMDSTVQRLSTADQWTAFLIWSFILGAGASWGAAALFNKAAAILPVALTGQLIVFETVFGVFYIFLAEGRLPAPLEFIGFSLAVLGIWWSIVSVHRQRRTKRAEKAAALQPPVGTGP